MRIFSLVFFWTLANCLSVVANAITPITCCADDTPAKIATKEAKPKALAKTERAVQKGAAPSIAIPAERETAALQFARDYHPELATLLENLKQMRPADYHAALVDLDRTVERLSKLKEKSTERYDFELADWKATSRIRLLAARLTMTNDSIVEAELRAALRERLDIRLASQRAERDRLQSRVAKLSQSIDETSAKSDAIIEKQFAELRKTLPDKPAGKNKLRKPADGTANGETK